MTAGLRRSELELLARARAGEDLPAAEAVAILERLQRTRLSPPQANAQLYDDVVEGFLVALHLRDRAEERADREQQHRRSLERELAQLRVIERETYEKLQQQRSRGRC